MYSFLPGKAFKYILVLFVACSGCSQVEERLSKDEVIEFAKAIEGTIAKGEAGFLNNAFDKTEFKNRMKLPDTNDGNGFATGVMSKLNLGTQLTASLSDRDNFNFIKHYEKDGKHHIIFRLFTDKDGSLNYHDYELLKRGGKCKIADAYIYLSGETLAESSGNMFRSFTEHTDGSNKQLNKENLDGLDELKEVKELNARGKQTEAKELYNKLPEYLKKTKPVQMIHLTICSGLGNDEYAAAINEFKQKFPDEPNMNLLMIDGYFMQKEYEKLLGAVNALDSQINKDPLLDYHRYLSYNLLKQDDKGRECLIRLLGNMPDFQKGYLEYIATELQAGNKKTADSLIIIYQNKSKFDQQQLNSLITYYR
jgi:hypothetical protein